MTNDPKRTNPTHRQDSGEYKTTSAQTPRARRNINGAQTSDAAGNRSSREIPHSAARRPQLSSAQASPRANQPLAPSRQTMNGNAYAVSKAAQAANSSRPTAQGSQAATNSSRSSAQGSQAATNSSRPTAQGSQASANSSRSSAQGSQAATHTSRSSSQASQAMRNGAPATSQGSRSAQSRSSAAHSKAPSGGKKKRPVNLTPFIILAIILIIVIVVVAKCSSGTAQTMAPVETNTASDTAATFAETTLPPVTTAPAAEATALGDNIYSQYAILIDASTGNVIASKNADTTAYPASLTKVMTAVVVLENVTDLEATYTLEEDMFEYIYSQSAATAGYESGETVRIIDLLNAMLIPSGAEASIALARYVAGSESEFAVLMNAKAKELGMSGTHYVNCTGLHDINHYTTAADMAKLMKYALANATFKNIISTQSYQAPATNLHPDGLTFTHTMFKAFANSGNDIGDVIGGKTGYTDLAGMCLASYEVKNGKTYICVTMGAGDGTNSTAWHVMDAETIYNTYT